MKGLTFDELVNRLLERFLDDLGSGTPLKKNIYNLALLVAQWSEDNRKS